MPARRFVYVSCAESKEIWVFAMEADGALHGLGRVPVRGTEVPSSSSMPLAVSPDRRFLYAALRTPPFPVTTFVINHGTGGLTPIASAPLADSMAYIATDRSGRHLLAASYPGAKLTSNPIDAEGRVQQAATQVVPTAPKAHAILPDPANRFVYAAVLGGDHIMQLGFDAETGRMTPMPPDAGCAPGAGPRHLRFHPTQDLVFALTEIAGTVECFARDPRSGRLTHLNRVSAVPDGEAHENASGADLHITPDGRFLYASIRASSTIAGFAVRPGGELIRIGTWPVPPVPRGIAIDPEGRFLLSAGLEANTLAVLAIDPRSGTLTPVAQHATGAMPNWIEFVGGPG